MYNNTIKFQIRVIKQHICSIGASSIDRYTHKGPSVLRRLLDNTEILCFTDWYIMFLINIYDQNQKEIY